MNQVDSINPSAGDVLVLAGTTKGLFIFHSDEKRERWQVAGPHFAGCEVYAAAYDGRGGRRRLLAAVMNPFFGSQVSHSDDFGKTWSNPEEINVKFPESAGLAVSKIWQIALAPESQPDTLYCGVDPAALFISKDGGVTWSLCEGLHSHPHRPQWQPGGGGLCLHTIVPNPKNADEIHIAISTGGVYRTRDGGKSWEARSKGIRADFNPDPYPEWGQCVHKIARNPHDPDVIYVQNHGGLYRSEDGADTWIDIGKGVPSDFGFPMVAHPHEKETIYCVPLDPMGRWGCEAKLRVYRSKNGGNNWEALSEGLPQAHAYETVLRDGMSADSCRSAGVYFGTRSGKVFGSRNGGDNWFTLGETLPAVTCVKVGMVA